MNVQILTPFDQDLGFAIVRDRSVCHGVSGLLFLGSPSAVSGFIIPIVVNSIQSHSARTLPHIGEEVCEVCPSIANRYAPTTIPVVRNVVFVPAPHPHRRPALIGRSKTGAVSSVGAGGARADRCQPLRPNRELPAAVAVTNHLTPLRCARDVGKLRGHGKPTKYFPEIGVSSAFHG